MEFISSAVKLPSEGLTEQDASRIRKCANHFRGLGAQFAPLRAFNVRGEVTKIARRFLLELCAESNGDGWIGVSAW